MSLVKYMTMSSLWGLSPRPLLAVLEFLPVGCSPPTGIPRKRLLSFPPSGVVDLIAIFPCCRFMSDSEYVLCRAPVEEEPEARSFKSQAGLVRAIFSRMFLVFRRRPLFCPSWDH